MSQLTWFRDPNDPLHSLRATPSNFTTYELREIPSGVMVLCLMKTPRSPATLNQHVGDRDSAGNGMLLAQEDWDSGNRS